MKTRFLYYIITLITLYTTLGCNNKEEQGDNMAQEFLVSFRMTGEITMQDTPLPVTRATTETISTDLYALQVLKKANGSTSYEPFAYGFFDTLSNMKVYLRNDGKYRIILTYLKNGKNIVSKGSNYYYFHQINVYNSDGSTYHLNKTIYSTGYSYLTSYFAKSGTNTYSKGMEYYGEVKDYEPVENGTIDMEMKLCGFGLQYDVTGITDGSVDLTIKNDKATFIDATNITSDSMGDPQVFSFQDLYSAWQYADNYTENVTISIQWKRSIGITQDLGSKTIQVKRNQMNIVHVKLGASDGSARIGIETESDNNMPTEQVTVTLPAS